MGVVVYIDNLFTVKGMTNYTIPGQIQLFDYEQGRGIVVAVWLFTYC